MKKRATLVASIALVLLVSPALAAPAPRSESLSAVLERFDVVQSQIRTLSAQFVQTTKNPILKQPLVAKGEFYLTKPDSVLWQYSSPEPMRFVVAHGEYTGYFPERKKAEKRDIRRWSEQLFRFFGLGQGSQELGKFYEITLGDAGHDMSGSHLLILSPKKRRVRRNVEEVKLWVDSGTLLPVRIDYVGKDGNEREIRFMNTRLNPDLAAGLYNVAIPPDVSVTTGFSGFDASARTH